MKLKCKDAFLLHGLYCKALDFPLFHMFYSSSGVLDRDRLYVEHFTSMDFKILVRIQSDIMLFLIQLFPQNSFASRINLSEGKHLIPTAKTNIPWLVIPLEVDCHLLDLSSSFVHWKFKQSPFLSPINRLLCTS